MMKKPRMSEDEFDQSIDDATHAVVDAFPVLFKAMTLEEHSDLLVRINDALTPILRDLIAIKS